MASRREIRSLTGLRGVAALTVVLYHFSHQWSPGTPRTIMGPGYLAVDLFFILSGFLMTMTYGGWFAGPFSWPQYKEFLWRRFARIYPVYFLAVIAEQILSRTHVDGRFLHISSLVSNLFLLQSTGIAIIAPRLGETLIGASWSLSTEIVAYLLFPAMILILGRKESPKRALVVAAVGLGALAAVALLGAHGSSASLDHNRAASFSPLIRTLGDYALGMSLWRFTHFLRDRRQPKFLGPALAVALLVLWQEPSTDLAVVPVLALIVGIIYRSTDRLACLLASPFAHLLGESSYSLYLIHDPSLSLRQPIQVVLSVAHVPHAFVFSYLLLIVIDVALAYAIFRLVETPAQRYLQRLRSSRHLPNIMAEPAAP